MFQLPIPSDFIVRKSPLPEDTFYAICEELIPKGVSQTKEAANKFRDSQNLTMDIWQWCRKDFSYDEDRLGFEELRLPRQSWEDRKEGIDCEDFVILISGILHNLGVSHTVRMADYGTGWQHIYVKVGKVTLDPVNTAYNQEPAFTRKKDWDFNPRKGLSGLPEKTKWDFVREITNGLKSNQVYTRATLQNLAKASYGIQDKEVVKELTEVAYFRQASDIVFKSTSPQSAFESLVSGYQAQANSSLRTSASMMLQQYSTPLPIAYLMGQFCGINQPISVFEPTAGNGFLLVAAGNRNLKDSWVNELSENRYLNLQWLADNYNFTVTQKDATDPAFYASVPTFSAVLANPPFGEIRRTAFDKIVTKKLDQLIVLHSLTRMKDDGRAAFLIGGHTNYDQEGRIMSKDKSTGDRYFFNYLYHHYHVVDVVNVNGDLYSRQGTQFDVRVILINGRKETPAGYAPLRDNANYTITDTWEQLWQRISPYFLAQSTEINRNSMKFKITHNTRQNGIEIKFEKMPDADTVSWLKANGYRWARVGHWYVIYTESRWKTINAKFGEGSTMETQAPSPVPAKSPEEVANEKMAQYRNNYNREVGYTVNTLSQFLLLVKNERPTHLTVGVMKLEMVYGPKGIVGSHMPKGRKRPDLYDLVTIHHLLQKHYLRLGGILIFEAYGSNPLNKSDLEYTQNLNYFIKTYPQQVKALDYKKWADQIAERTRLKQKEIDRWNEYRKKYLKEGQTVYVKNMRLKGAQGEKKFLKGTIDSIVDNSFYPSRHDTVRVTVPMSIIFEVGDRLLSDVYFENPDVVPTAKSVLELYPIDGPVKDVSLTESLTAEKNAMEAVEEPPKAKTATSTPPVNPEELKQWDAYRKKHLTVGQEVWVVSDDSDYLKPREEKVKVFVKGTVASLTLNPRDVTRPNFLKVNLWNPMGSYPVHRPLKKVYFENPDVNELALSVLEMYPMEEKQASMYPIENARSEYPMDGKSQDSKDTERLLLEMEIEAEAIAIELELLLLTQK